MPRVPHPAGVSGDRASAPVRIPSKTSRGDETLSLLGGPLLDDREPPAGESCADSKSLSSSSYVLALLRDLRVSFGVGAADIDPGVDAIVLGVDSTGESTTSRTCLGPGVRCGESKS